MKKSILILLVTLVLGLFSCKQNETAKVSEEEKQAVNQRITDITTGFEKTESGLWYKIISKGTGKKPEKGQTVSVHYKGSLLDGTEFDSSYKRNQPILFSLGKANVIAGWDEGVALLNVGDKARFVIPSSLAYGTKGAGRVIPPNATLIFDVELINVN